MSLDLKQSWQQILDAVTAQLPAWGAALKEWAKDRGEEEITKIIEHLKHGNTVQGLSPIAATLDDEAFDAWIKLVSATGAAATDNAAGHYAVQWKALEIIGSFLLTILSML